MIDAVQLLKRLVATPSPSRCEADTAALLFDVMSESGLSPRRHFNNVWAVSDNYDLSRPTLLLNSHHDTVKPSPAYTRDPFKPTVEDGRLYGLGSNDAGASVVSLLSVFAELREAALPFNLILALSAEEEVTGEHGIRALLPHMADEGYRIDMALVGEPTEMQPAVGERGLVVLDCVSHGVTGHAARNEGVNALYKAIDDIEKLRHFEFDRCSPLLGPISMQVTQIEAGRQHNVVPEECRWVVDVRTTDAYTNEQTVEILQALLEADATPRSTRVRASAIDASHPLVVAATEMGKTPFVSPTTSDMSQMAAFPSIKMGPGKSSRSHSADEFVMIEEIDSAIKDYRIYLNLLSKLLQK